MILIFSFPWHFSVFNLYFGVHNWGPNPFCWFVVRMFIKFPNRLSESNCCFIEMMLIMLVMFLFISNRKISM